LVEKVIESHRFLGSPVLGSCFTIGILALMGYPDDIEESHFDTIRSRPGAS